MPHALQGYAIFAVLLALLAARAMIAAPSALGGAPGAEI
jgi:hypothetical protein